MRDRNDHKKVIEDDDIDIRSHSFSDAGSSPSNVRINLNGGEEADRRHPDNQGRRENNMGRGGIMDVDEKTKSLTESYIETEKEDNQYYMN